MRATINSLLLFGALLCAVSLTMAADLPPSAAVYAQFKNGEITAAQFSLLQGQHSLMLDSHPSMTIYVTPQGKRLTQEQVNGLKSGTHQATFQLPTWMPAPFDGTPATCKLGIIETTPDGKLVCVGQRSNAELRRKRLLALATP